MTDTFMRLIRHREARRAHHDALATALQNEWNQEVVATAKSAKPKAKNVTTDKAIVIVSKNELARVRLAAIQAERFDARAKKISDDRMADERAMTQELRAAAEAEALSPPAERTTWMRRDWLYGGSYASQGFGSQRYLEGYAKLVVAAAEALGVEARVDIGVGGLDVMVLLRDERDLLLMKYKPPRSLYADVRDLLKMGLNPRVIFPHLPYNIESQLGLDAWGNDLPAGNAVLDHGK